jgi:hypothetical protein
LLGHPWRLNQEALGERVPELVLVPRCRKSDALDDFIIGELLDLQVLALTLPVGLFYVLGRVENMASVLHLLVLLLSPIRRIATDWYGNSLHGSYGHPSSLVFALPYYRRQVRSLLGVAATL